MKVAVVGGGIAGIAAAYLLDETCEVTLFEAAYRLGGHTDTHVVDLGDGPRAVDSGFIVFNRLNYPLFSAWLDKLGVGTRASSMSFSVSDRRDGFEYGTERLPAVLCRARNACDFGFLRMLRDITAFYREAASISETDSQPLEAWVAARGYSERFLEQHLVPMCSALWSQPPGMARRLPIGHVVAFFRHHRMLKLTGRPEWRVVDDGSSQYLDAFKTRFGGRIHLGSRVEAVRRDALGPRLYVEGAWQRFDALVLACHSDQALGMLEDASAAEREVLGAIGYQENEVIVHSDERFMPRARRAWSSWNAMVDGADDFACRLTYWMNRLQGFDSPLPAFVTLNPEVEPRAGLVHCRRTYAHPVFNAEAVRAQRRKQDINGVHNTYFCGAYWGWGFHEDGFASAVDAVNTLMRQRERRHAA
jgi:predicted NAD/FAD-binding protein